MAKSVSAFLVVLVFAISTLGQDGWIKREYSKGMYSVEMPAGDPSMTTRKVPDTDGNDVVLYSMAVNDGLARFIVGYYDNSTSRNFSSSKARDRIVKQVNGRLVSDKTTKIGGLAVRMLKIQSATNGTDILIMARIYNAHSRVYLAQVIFPMFEEGAAIDAKVKRFFDSFLVTIDL